MGHRSGRIWASVLVGAIAPLMALESMPALATELGELSLQERGGRFVVHRSGVPLDDDHFLYLLESKHADYNFTYHARRTQESLNFLHWGGTALGVWSAYLAYSLISRGVRMQAASYPENADLTNASAANGRFEFTLGVQFAVASVVSLATWLYNPRAFDVGGAQEAMENYNRTLHGAAAVPLPAAPVAATSSVSAAP